jgi:hypothetical protein
MTVSFMTATRLKRKHDIIEGEPHLGFSKQPTKNLTKTCRKINFVVHNITTHANLYLPYQKFLAPWLSIYPFKVDCVVHDPITHDKTCVAPTEFIKLGLQNL